MDLNDYIKLRCDLNNKDYKEVHDKWETGADTFKVEKMVKDSDNNIKYQIRYTIKDYGESVNKEEFRYNATVCTTFFVKRDDVPREIATFINHKYDTFSMYYHFSYYKNPSSVEQVFEDTWTKLNIFCNNPYLKDKTI